MDPYQQLECYKILLFLTKLNIKSAEPAFYEASNIGDWLQQQQEDENEKHARWRDAMRMSG